MGSTNFDDCSFDTNDEITLEQWQKRNWWDKLKANTSYLLHNLL